MWIRCLLYFLTNLGFSLAMTLSKFSKGLDPILKTNSSNDVYVMTDGSLHLIPSYNTFVGLGYHSEDVNIISVEDFDALPIGSPLNFFGQDFGRDDIKPEHFILPASVVNMIGDRNINIKIGVLNEKARNSKHFWLEFDPFCDAKLSSNNFIIPLLVTGVNETKSPFHHHYKAGCSGIFLPADNSLASDPGRFRAAFIEACDEVAAKYPIKFWDADSTIDATVRTGLNPARECSLSSYVQLHEELPSISLGGVLSALPKGHHLHLLDIDAQGADLELILAAGDDIKMAKHIKFECQTGMWLYHSRVPNDCHAAIAHLEGKGFELLRMEVNNCGIKEFNVFMHNEPLRYDGSEDIEFIG